MEKTIYFYKYIDGVNDLSFPEQGQIQTSEFRVDYKRMGAAPTITCTILHHLCLDKIWDENVYVVFNNERFFLKQIPTSSYSNSDSRYKHDVELVGERAILDDVYFYDVATDDIEVDKPISNSSNFVFFGDIHEFASRLNYSLSYSNVDYKVVVDSDITSESKSVSFQDQFISNALQECYNVYGLPYYFIGKTIHIGFTNNAVTHTFKYGVDESLLSIQKQNANYKIVNRVTGVGSSDNIPYYYPNDYESKEQVEANGGIWVAPQTNLMPPIYRETLGDERFYNALNNTYISPQTGEFYSFENPFVEGKPKEHIVNFDYIKPTIKGITNSEGLRIDIFKEFAYDANDNDEVDEEGNSLHPYFFGKLRRFDGEYGFNLFDHSIDESEMTISMTSGSCGGCEFVIGVNDENQKNLVQVDERGNLLRDEQGNVRCGREGMQKEEPQDAQNDTRNNEVWVALKKDINTFGVIMPNAYHNYKPSVNDTFVILHIDLPKAYILAAENNLKEQLIKYMAMNNSEKFTFSIEFSRIFFAENPQILEQLNENARIQIEYDNEYYDLYVSSYSYSMSDGIPLPEIKVELSDTLTVQQNALQNAISEVKQDIMSSIGSVDFLKQGLAYFLRKDTSDRTRGKLSSDVGFEVGKYVSGASGAIIYKDSSTGQTIGEVDKLYVRMKAYFETLAISDVDTISGKQIISPAGSIKCIGVDELENSYRCYFLGEQDGSETSNLFHVNDQAYSQTFNAKEGVNNKISNTYYWRLITDVSSDVVVYNNHKCHYIDLSKADCDYGSDIPKEGDIINHRGNRTDVDRMNFIESSSVDAFSPNITLFHGVNSYSLDGKDYVSYGVDKTTNKAYMNVYGDMFVGDRNGSTYMRYTPEDGLVIKGKLDIETKLGDSTLKDLISASSPEGYQEFVEKITQDIEGLQQQIDGAIDSYFYQYEPTLSNYPASSWDTDELKKSHLNDTFTNLVDGRSWRWTIENGNYKWTEITDTATTQALALAGQAKDSADGKRRVFIETPYPPYDLGDLWSRGSEFPLMICIVQKTDGLYEESDWGYADNNTELKDGIDSLNYLKDALKEDTSIEGGLIQSSLIKLGYTSSNAFNVMSGSNGIYNSALHGGGIASWWGGDTYDLLDYYIWDGTQWIEKSGVTVPNNIPSGLIRFDGTGYFAKGKFWWDNNGEIHADPTALFLSFDVEVGDETLAQTIVSLRTNLGKLAELWVKVDVEGGISYIKTNNGVVSNGDIIAYSTGPSLPSLPIASSSNYGLVKIDGATLRYDDNGRLYVAVGGGSGGGISSVIPSGSGNAVTGLIYDSSSKSLTYQLGNSFLPLSGGTMNNTNLVGNLNSDMLDGLHESAFLRYRGETVTDQESTLWHSLGIKQYINALPDGLTGVYNYGEVISLIGTQARFDMYVAHTSTNTDYEHGIWVRSGWVDDKKPWRRLAFISDTVAAANKLSTTRYLWGSPFDGSGDVYGDLKSIDGYNFVSTTSNYVLFGYGYAQNNKTVFLDGSPIYFRYGTNHNVGMILNSNGRVGIGVDYPTHKLHINGSIKAEYNPDYNLAHDIVGEAHFYTDSYSEPATGILSAIKVSGTIAQSGGNVLLCTKSGNVGIGTLTPVSELHVVGRPIFNHYGQHGDAGLMIIRNDASITGWDRTIFAYYPNLEAGAHANFHIGKADSEKNGGYISYYHAGDSSGNNCMTIGLYAVDDILNVTANRRVGINTTTPQEALDVNGNIKLNGEIRFTDGEYAYSHAIYGGHHGIDVCEFYENEFKFKTNGGDITSFTLNRYYADFNGTVRSFNCDFTGIHWNGNTRFRLARDGEYNTWLQAGTDTTAENGRLYMSGLSGSLLHQFNVFATTSKFKGSIIAEGDVTAYSDIRLKNRIESVNNVLDTIDTLDVFRYTWKDSEDKSVHIGVSAQQVQTIYPEFVLTSSSEDGTDYLTVNYAALATCIAIQGIKELVKKGDERDKKIVSLEKEINNLKERIKTLEAWS